MTGLAQILEENRRLRALLAEREAALEVKETVIAAKETAIAAKDAELDAQRTELAKRDAIVDALRARADQLEQSLEWLKLKAKRPASERFVLDTRQAQLFVGDVEAPPRAPEPEPAEEDAPAQSARGRGSKRRPKRRRREDFSHLTKHTVRCPTDPTATCAGCGGALKVIGKAQSFRVEWVPGHFIVEDVIRDKCACPACPGHRGPARRAHRPRALRLGARPLRERPAGPGHRRQVYGSPALAPPSQAHEA